MVARLIGCLPRIERSFYKDEKEGVITIYWEHDLYLLLGL